MDLSVIDQYSDRNSFIKVVKKQTFDTEMKCHGCAQVVVQTFLDVLKIDNQAVSMAASPFAAGLSLTGNNCGAVIGGLMVLGLEFGRRDVHEGMEGILRGIRPMRKLIRYFEQKYSALDCRDLTGTDLADPTKAQRYFDSGGLKKCATMMADAAGFAAGVLYDERKNQSH